MWEEQIAAASFVKRRKQGIVCELLFLDGRRKTLKASGFDSFRDVLEAIGSNDKNIKARTGSN